MKSKSCNNLWAIFSLILWLQIIPAIFDPPWIEVDTLHDETYFSFAPNAHSDREYAKNLSVIEFEVKLIESSIIYWLWWSILSALGIYSSWLIHKNAKYWSILVVVITGLSCLRTIPITIQLVNFSPSVIHHFSLVWRLFVKAVAEDGSLSYFMYLSRIYVWPYLCLILFIYSGFKLITKIIHSKLPPNKRMQSDQQTATRFVDR